MARDYASYRGRAVVIRGIYFDGLRQKCPHKCADGYWPAFLWLNASDEHWRVLGPALRTAWTRARQGERVEVWATVEGVLNTYARKSPLGPCDRIGSGYFGFGHLGVAPAELKVTRVWDVVVTPNPASPFDYSDTFPARAL